MSRISKDLAGQISIKLTEKSRIKSTTLHEEYRELITAMFEDQTPQAIRDALKKYPEWVYTRNYVCFTGHGFQWEQVKTTRPIVSNADNNSNLSLTAKSAEKIMTAKRKYEKALKEYTELRRETEQALLTLKTFTNIRKELPDASAMLPPPLSNALVVNFESLKTRLKKQPDVKPIVVV